MCSMRVAVAIVLATVGLLLAGIPMFMHPPTGYVGLRIAPTPIRGQFRVERLDRGSPAARAGVRDEDVISCLDYRDVRFLEAPIYTEHSYGMNAGEAIAFCATRDGVTRAVTVVPETKPPARSLYGNDAGAAFRLLEYSVFLVCGVLLVYGRPGLMSWLFMFYALATAPNAMGYINLTVLPSPLYMAYSIGLQAFDFASSGFLLMFTLLVPDERLEGWRRPAFAVAVLLFVLVALYNVVVPLYLDTNAKSFLPRLPETIVSLLTLVAVGARLATMSPEVRSRFRWAAFGISWGVIMIAIGHRALPIGGDEAGVVAALLSVVMPIAMLYAVLRAHLIDLRFVLSRTIVYAVITTCIVGIIGVVDWLTAQYLHESRVATIIDAGVTIALAIALHRTYGWIEEAIDFVLFRKKYQAENYLRRLARSLLVADEATTIDTELLAAPYVMLDLSMAVLYRSDGTKYAPTDLRGVADAPAIAHDDELIRFLKAEHKAVHFSELRTPPVFGTPALAIAIPRARGLGAFVVYGYHRDGTTLDPDEVDVLERLCDAAGRAYVDIDLARLQPVPI